MERIIILEEENKKLRVMLEQERQEHKEELQYQANRFETDKHMIIDKFDQEILSMFKELKSVCPK
jgi:hypothetical protein